MLSEARPSFELSNITTAPIRINERVNPANDFEFSQSTVTTVAPEAIRLQFDKMMASIVTNTQSVAADDNSRKPLKMSDVTREEISARLEAVEARMDARVAGMSAKLDTALAEMRADREANSVRFAAVAKDIGDIKADLSGTKASFRTVIGNVWGAAVATITIVAAIVGFGIAAFDSGRETSKSIAEATAQMKQLQMQLEAQAKAAASPPATTAPAPSTPPASQQ